MGPRRSVANAEDCHRLEERYFSQQRTFEELPCTAATLDVLDLKLFQNDFLPLAIEKEIIEDDIRTIEQQLAALRFYDLEERVLKREGFVPVLQQRRQKSLTRLCVRFVVLG